MRRDEFNFELPGDLIAQRPLPERSASRLLCLDGETGNVRDRTFRDLPRLLRGNDLLVFNDTRVMPARLFGRKESGGKVECLVERVTGEFTARVQVRASKLPKTGTRILLQNDDTIEIIERVEPFFNVRFSSPVIAVLERQGHVPLPPYIRRADEAADRERYQTVFAVQPGAVAAPTAGLHFDDALLGKLAERDIATTSLTLHVGAGTFQPVRAEYLEDHEMHSEWYDVGADLVDAIAAARDKGGRVIAVGTTVVRALETLAQRGELQAGSGETDIFIYPGFKFRCVDAMLTNFHLPESSLVMLVCAFAGKENLFAAYRHAIKRKYRFFSYGDAMFITPQTSVRTE